MSTTEQGRNYLPAAGHDWFLPLYDPMVKLFGGNAARKTLIEQAGLKPGQSVLEIGCGTGTLLTMIQRSQPGLTLTGLDPDPKALVRAKKKAKKMGISIQLDQGFSDHLPYPPASFDHIFSSFMFHHLPAEEKLQTLREVRRVLKPGGVFHMVDFRKEHSAGLLSKWFHPSHRMADNTDERIMSLLNEAGLQDARATRHSKVLMGEISYYSASQR